MNKIVLIYFFVISSLFANECNEYFIRSKFYEAPNFLEEIIEKSIIEKGLPIFGAKRHYDKLGFDVENSVYVDKFQALKEYKYPVNNGLFEYKVDKGYVNEFSIAQIELYQYTQFEIANSLNSQLEEYWYDWIENAYEMKLLPEQTLFQYKDKYFAFSIYIYGVIGDSSQLNTTVIKYSFKDFTQEVNDNMSCLNKNKE